MDEGQPRTPDQSTNGREQGPPRPRQGGRHRRLSLPPSAARATAGDPTSFEYVMTRVIRPPDIPPIAWETLMSRIGELPTLLPDKPEVFDELKDDKLVEIRRRDGKKWITQKELQKLMDEDPPEKIVVTPQVIQAIMDNPRAQLKVRVAAVSEANEWLVGLESDIKEGNLPQTTEAWTGDPQYVDVDSLRLPIPSGIDVVDSGRDVPVGLKAIYREIYSQRQKIGGKRVSDRVLSALIGQFMHESHDWKLLDEEQNVEPEVEVQSGIIDAYSAMKLEIGELKSDNPSELVKGVGQVIRYIIELNKKFKVPHSGRIHFYHTTDTRNT